MSGARNRYELAEPSRVIGSTCAKTPAIGGVQARPDESLDWPLSPGRHTIAVAVGALRDETTILVK